MKNELAGDLALAATKSQYDACCKRILANKIILAWILKYVTDEFADMSVDEIKKCIGPDVQISEVSVLPGRTNMQEQEKIIGEAQEDAVPGEGELSYDIRFSVYYSEQKHRIKLIINVEAQKEFNPGYAIVTRGIFYGSRMISAQKGTEFTGRDYDNIRKVYSIWICMNAPDYIGNAISEYSMYKKDRIPGIPDEKKAYDKLTVVMVCLNAKVDKGNRLTRMLGVLLSPQMKVTDKITQLENEYEIPMENEMGKEMNEMCNLSDYVEELGIQKGIEHTYDLFLTRCSDGRGLPKDSIDHIGQGRVWTGEQALDRGLVDKLGGMDVAIEEAASLAGVTAYTVTTANTKKDFFTEYMEKMMGEAKVSFIRTALGEEDFAVYSNIQRMKSQTGVQARMPYLIQGL